jgi:DNA (cytosine-5)-methyltransferase 1
MKYLSLCSGIEAATVAWHPLGWEAVAYSEIERFPSEVLAHHYPSTPNLGDMTKFKEWSIESNVDLLVGGTPCQSFSVAGLRKGLDDPRGNLMLTYLAIAKQYRPNWLVWENVPGVLSSNGGRDFGSFLGGLAECGYGFAYRVLDAQFFGVAQRRRRVFVVGYLGDWRAAAAVLFERHSLQGHPAPSREKRQGVAGYVESSFGQYREDSIGGTAKASGGVLGGGSETFIAQPVYEMHGQDSRVRDLGDTCSTVTSTWGTGGGNVPVALQPIGFEENFHAIKETQTAPAMTTKGYGVTQNAGGLGIRQSMAVRRLTPVECERLQGFPDNYTDIKLKNKPTPDGPRYKALGNSMAVPVMAWIGQRIEQVEAICKQNK